MADINILCNLIECLYPCPACIHSYLFIIYRNQVSDKVDGTRSDSLWKVHHKIRRLGIWNTRGRALYLRSHSLSRFVSMQLVAVQADPIIVMIRHFYASSNNYATVGLCNPTIYLCYLYSINILSIRVMMTTENPPCAST